MKNRPSADHNRRILMVSLANACAGGLARHRFGGALVAAAAAVQPRPAAAAQTVTEERTVSGFDEVVFAAAGDLYVSQAQREHLSIEAEPEILRKITSEVHGKRLTLGFAPGNVIARAPIRFRLKVRDLCTLELQTTGDAHLSPIETASLSLLLSGSGDIDAERPATGKLDVRIGGSGTVSIRGGQTETLRIVIGGAGAVNASDLKSREAKVSIDGSGDVRLLATEHLAADIAGSGSVRYAGDPRLTQSITGAGTIERD